MQLGIKDTLSWVLVLIISILLFVLSFFSFQLSWIAKPEEFITAMPTNFKHWAEKAKEVTHKNDDSYIEDNFILINTSKDQAIAVEEGAVNSPKKIAITDRAKLAELFKWLSDSQHLHYYETVVCDLQFIDRADSAADKELEKYIHEMLQPISPNIIFAGEYNGDAYKPSIFSDMNAGAVMANTSYEIFEKEDFLAYTLLIKKGHVRSLPLALYEKTHPVRESTNKSTDPYFKEGILGVLYRPEPKATIYMWNNFIPEIYFEQEELAEIEEYQSYEANETVTPSTTMIRLGTAISDSFALEVMCDAKKNNKSVKGRKPIIFIGSFSGAGDTHKTLYGQTSGSLVLLNIFHSLDKGKNAVCFGYLFFLFCMLFLISTDIVFRGTKFTKGFFFCLSMVFFAVPLLILWALGTKGNYFKRMSKAATHWINEKSHFFVLLLTGMIANAFFDRLINCIVIAFVVFIFDKLLKFAKPQGNHEY